MKHSLANRFLRCAEYICWAAGALAISYFVFVRVYSLDFQAHAAKRLASLEQSHIESRVHKPEDPFGRISIPRIGVSAIVEEGVDESTLRDAVGHFPASPTPEMPGTVALAGHRDSFFRPLARVRTGDLIILETPRGVFRYRVARTFVVNPDDIQVIHSSAASDLTLVTCYPFRYVGHAPQRFIVQAYRTYAPGKTAKGDALAQFAAR